MEKINKNLKKYVEDLEKLSRRNRGEYIKNKLRDFGYDFTVQKFRAFFRNGENIIVNIEGRKNKGRVLLFTAHYDQTLRSPGANDNASGVAVLLGLLQRAREEEFKQSVRIIFFDLEEIFPTMGSRYYVKTCGYKDIDYMYNLDMVGMGEVVTLWRHISQDGTNWLEDTIQKIKEKNVPIIRTNTMIPLVNFLPIMGFASDHSPFINAGFLRVCSLTMIPSEDIDFQIELEKGNGIKFMFFRIQYLLTGKGRCPEVMKHYHSTQDTSVHVNEYTLQIISDIMWHCLLT